METPSAARDLEAAVPAAPAAAAAAKAEPKAAAVAGKAEQEKQAAPAAKKVAEEEDPRLRWAFVRKVYAILSLQFALTAAVATVACLVRPIPRFFAVGPPAAVWPTFIVILVSPLIGARASAFPHNSLPRFWVTDRGFVCLVWFCLCSHVPHAQVQGEAPQEPRPARPVHALLQPQHRRVRLHHPR